MAAMGPQSVTIRSADPAAILAACASLKVPQPCSKAPLKTGVGAACSAVASATSGRGKAVVKGCEKTSGSNLQARSTDAADGGAVFLEIMACLLPAWMNTQLVAPTGGDAAKGTVELQGKKPAAVAPKAEAVATVAKSNGDGSAGKLCGEVKAATSPALALSTIDTPALLSSQTTPQVPCTLHAAVVTSSVSSTVAVKATDAGALISRATHEPQGERHFQGDSRVLAATSGVLEVGISGGSHGWLRVRAELGDEGLVTASLLTSSAGSAEVLDKELPSISAFLASEQVGISNVVVHAAERGAGAQDAAMSFGAGTSGQQNARHQRESQVPELSFNPLFQDIEVAFPRLGAGWGGLGVLPGLIANSGGGWLSVMA